MTSSTDKEYLGIYFKHMLEKPSINLQAVWNELGIANATAKNRFYKSVNEVNARSRYADSVVDRNASINDTMTSSGTRMATRSSTNSSRKTDYQDEDGVDDEYLYYDSSLAEDEDADATEESPYQNGTATSTEQHSSSAATTTDTVPSFIPRARQTIRGLHSEWSDAEVLLACLKHTLQKPAIDFVAIGKDFDWESLHASNGSFPRMAERLGPRWDKELVTPGLLTKRLQSGTRYSWKRASSI